MNYLKKISFTLLLLFTFSQSESYSRSLCQSPAIIMGGVAVAGAVIYAYKSYYNSIYYHKNVVEHALKSFNRSLNYIEPINEICNKYNLNFMSESDKRIAIGRISEDLNFNLVQYIAKIGIDNYLPNLNSDFLDLKMKFLDLERTVDKLKSKPNIDSDFYHQSKNLFFNIQKMIPNLEFLQEYVTNHKSYFKLYEIGDKTNDIFQTDFVIFMTYIEPGIVEELKRHARIRFANSSYPYLDYVNYLTQNINDIESVKTSFLYTKLNNEVHNLKNKLLKIKQYIVGDVDYFAQAQKYKEDKQKEEKIKFDQAVKARELQLKEQKLREERELREREVQAREKEARIKELELQEKLNRQRIATGVAIPVNPQPQIHVHLN